MSTPGNVFRESYAQQQNERNAIGMDRGAEEVPTPDGVPDDGAGDEPVDYNDLDALDDEHDDDDDEQQDETERSVKTTCPQCGEARRILPPVGHAFVPRGEDEDEDEEEAEGEVAAPRMSWKCPQCESENFLRLRRHRLVKRASEAVATFRRAYRGWPSPLPRDPRFTARG